MKQFSGFGLLALLVMVIELASRTALLDPIYFPAPTRVLSRLSELIVTFPFWMHISSTLVRALVGFAAAMIIAVPIGLLVGESRFFRNLLEPLIEVLRPIPSAAIIPVAILLFGIDNSMKIAVIIFGSMWSTIVSTTDGVTGVDSLLIDTGRLMRFNRFQILFRIIFPSALPNIMTGMRISLAIALILTITSEMIAGSNGLGYFILDSQRSFMFPDMFCGIIIIGAIGYLSSRGFVAVDRRLLYWFYASKSGRT